jgi:hypothetical protein
MKRHPNEYLVIAGSIGTVHTGPSRERAEKEFVSYVRDSRRGYGRIANEPVFLMKNGELLREYDPNIAPKRRLEKIKATRYTRQYMEHQLMVLSPTTYKIDHTFTMQIKNGDRETHWLNITGAQMRRIERVLLSHTRDSEKED